MEKMNKTFAVVFIFFFCVQSVFAEEKLSLAAGIHIPGTIREMKSPGFWVSRHPSPDTTILDEQAIIVFNQKLSKKGLIKDLLDIDAFDLNISRAHVQRELQKFERGDFFDQEGKMVSRDYYKRLKENILLDDIQDFVPRYAFVLRQSDQRLLPSEQILTAEPFDLEFDEVQNSSLDAGEALAVFFETLDGKWVYAQSAASAGWVKKDNLAFISLDEFKNLLTSEHFVVVTAAKTDLYLNPERTKFYDYVRMGAKFAVSEMRDDVVEVWVAPGQVVFIDRRDVHIGYLTYTPRVIIEQAFKMLNAPYGWGGMNGEQDCSAFLKGVFATVGMMMPRNSGEQGKAGTSVKKIDDALAGISVAQMKGHIVLYLGQFNGRPFAIHEAYAYREPFETGERARVVNRVIVSDMHLGKGSRKGSLLERTVAIREIR